MGFLEDDIDEGLRRTRALDADFLGLWLAHADWSTAVFGPSSYRGPRGPIRHLQKEAKELEEAPHDASEYADCLLLLMDAARRAGYSPEELIGAARSKLKANKARVWPDWRSLPGDVAIEHKRQGGGKAAGGASPAAKAKGSGNV